MVSFSGTANLFAGSGGDLNATYDDLVVSDEAVGFVAQGATLDLVLAIGATADGANAGDTYLGVTAALASARLLGVED